MHMDAGLQGRAHIHQDKLTGLATYEQQGWWWRRSCMTIPGGLPLLTRPQYTVTNTSWRESRQLSGPAATGDRPAAIYMWHSAPGVDYCQGWCWRWRQCRQPEAVSSATRSWIRCSIGAVLFVKPRWVVHDTLFATDQSRIRRKSSITSMRRRPSSLTMARWRCWRRTRTRPACAWPPGRSRSEDDCGGQDGAAGKDGRPTSETAGIRCQWRRRRSSSAMQSVQTVTRAYIPAAETSNACC